MTNHMVRSIAAVVMTSAGMAIAQQDYSSFRFTMTGTLDEASNPAFIDSIGGSTWSITGEVYPSFFGPSATTRSATIVGGHLGAFDIGTVGPPLLPFGLLQVRPFGGLQDLHSGLTNALFFPAPGGVDFRLPFALVSDSGQIVDVGLLRGFGTLPVNTIANTPFGQTIEGFQISLFEVQTIFETTVVTGRIDTLVFSALPAPGTAGVVAALGFVAARRRRVGAQH